MTSLPVICDNPDCGQLFFVDGVVGIHNSKNVQIKNVSLAEVCPKCRSDGHIVDGSYSKFFDDALGFVVSPATKVVDYQKLRTIFERSIQKELTLGDLRAVVREEIPQYLEPIETLFEAKEEEAKAKDQKETFRFRSTLFVSILGVAIAALALPGVSNNIGVLMGKLQSQKQSIIEQAVAKYSELKQSFNSPNSKTESDLKFKKPSRPPARGFGKYLDKKKP